MHGYFKIRILLTVSLIAALLIGRNYPMFEFAGRTIYLGPVEIVLPIAFIVSMAIGPRSRLTAPAFRNVFASAALYTAIIFITHFINSFNSVGLITGPAIIQSVKWIMYMSIFPTLIVLVDEKMIAKIAIWAIIVFSLANSLVVFDQATEFNFAEKRVYGLFVSGAIEDDEIMNANSLGVHLALSTVLLFGLLPNCTKSVQGLILFALMVTASSTALTLSRTAMLSILAGTIHYQFRTKKVNFQIIFCVVILLGVVFGTVIQNDFLLTRIQNSFSISDDTIDANSIIIRIRNSFDALLKIDQYILLGFGLGNSQVILNGLIIDNQYLQIMVENGLAGLIAFLIMIYVVNQSLRQTDNQIAASGLRFSDLIYSVNPIIQSILIAFYIANISGALFDNPRLLGMFWVWTSLGLVTSSKYPQ